MVKDKCTRKMVNSAWIVVTSKELKISIQDVLQIYAMLIKSIFKMVHAHNVVLVQLQAETVECV